MAALLLMLAAFSLAWLWLMINRYRLARLESDAEETARRRGLPGLTPPRSRAHDRGRRRGLRVAAYGGILGAVAVYAVTLVRRLRRAQGGGQPEERSRPLMTLVRPAPPRATARLGTMARGRRSARILAWLVFSGLSNALVYYLTPTELAARAAPPSARRSGWAGWSCPAA